MRDARLKELPFEFRGKTYQLRCNMNVLADVQEAFGGNIGAALDEKKTLRSVTEFLAAMLNDYADEQHWPERVTAKEIGRELPYTKIPTNEVIQLVTSALIGEKTDTEAENEGN